MAPDHPAEASGARQPGRWSRRRRADIIPRPPRSGRVPEERYNPHNKGWGAAAIIITLAILANVTAYTIHKATYLKPDKPRQEAAQH